MSSLCGDYSALYAAQSRKKKRKKGLSFLSSPEGRLKSGMRPKANWKQVMAQKVQRARTANAIFWQHGLTSSDGITITAGHLYKGDAEDQWLLDGHLTLT